MKYSLDLSVIYIVRLYPSKGRGVYRTLRKVKLCVQNYSSVFG